MSLTHEYDRVVADDVTVNANSPVVSDISTTILKNVRGWWDIRRKWVEKTVQIEDEIGEKDVLMDHHDHDKDPIIIIAHAEMKEVIDPTILPSAAMVKEFAQQTTDRTREQQRNHHEYVALLRENRQKARPVATAKKYERIQRWWTVCQNIKDQGLIY